MLSLPLFASFATPLLALMVVRWLRSLSRIRDKALVILSLLLPWTWLYSCPALLLLLYAVSLRRLILKFWPVEIAPGKGTAVQTKSERCAEKKQLHRLLKRFWKQSRVLQNLRRREKLSWLDWGKDIIVKGFVAYCWLSLALCFAVTFSGILAMLKLLFFIYMYSMLTRICVQLSPPGFAGLQNLQDIRKTLCLLLRAVLSARLLYLSLHGDPVASGAIMLMLARAHCQLSISCRLWSAAFAAAAQGDIPCSGRVLWTVLAWCVPLLPPAQSASDVQMPSLSAGSAAQPAPQNTADLMLGDLPAFLEAQVHQGHVQTPAIQKLLTDISVVDTWRRRPNRDTGRAVHQLCSPWGVATKVARRHRPLADIAHDLEQKMLEDGKKLLPTKRKASTEAVREGPEPASRVVESGLVLRDVPSLLQAHVGQRTTPAPAVQQLLADIPVLEAWRREPTKVTGIAMRALGLRWNVQRQRDGNSRPVANVANDLEERMLEQARTVLGQGNVEEPAKPEPLIAQCLRRNEKQDGISLGPTASVPPVPTACFQAPMHCLRVARACGGH